MPSSLGTREASLGISDHEKCLIFFVSFVLSDHFQSYRPVPVAARSKAWVCGRSPAEIVGFESHRRHGWMSVVSVVCCQVEVSETS